EVRVSSVVRYLAGFSPLATPFVPDLNTSGLWHLDDGSGSSAADSSSNVNTGTLIGGPTWTMNAAETSSPALPTSTPIPTGAAAANCPCSLWSGSAAPQNSAIPDSNSVE